MLQVDLGRPAPARRACPSLTARLPALERLAPLWPSVPRQVTGSATVELRVSRLGVRHLRGALDPEGCRGRAPRRTPEPSRRLGRRAGPAGRDRARRRPRSGRALTVGELIGYGVVLYDDLGASAGRRQPAHARRPSLRAVLGAGSGDGRRRARLRRALRARAAHRRGGADRGVHGGVRRPRWHDDRPHAVRSGDALPRGSFRGGRPDVRCRREGRSRSSCWTASSRMRRPTRAVS